MWHGIMGFILMVGIILGLCCVAYGAMEDSLSRFGRLAFIVAPILLFELSRSYNICGSLELSCVGNQFFYDVFDIGNYVFDLFIAASILVGASVIFHEIKKNRACRRLVEIMAPLKAKPVAKRKRAA
jgi:hypothetical protein